MKRVLLPLLVLAAALPAQEESPANEAEYLVGDALTAENCRPMVDALLPNIETFTRMKFRRPVPLRIMPKEVWQAMQSSDASTFAGNIARHGVAFYSPGENTMTLIPWSLDNPKNPVKKPLRAWFAQAEGVLIHELTHAIHHQNFWTEGRYYAASLRKSGIAEEDLDRSTVDFILSEGFAELVALRTVSTPGEMFRHPEREVSGPTTYMKRYETDGKREYRVILSDYGYQDGMTLLHHLSMQGGMRAVRSVLYRPPHRLLLFQPEALAKVNLDDPPEPDPIFRLLHPGPLSKEGIFLAVSPGEGRLFDDAVGSRHPGCLLGYVAKAMEGDTVIGRYAFYVADPDSPGNWIEEQAGGLLKAGSAKEEEAPLPLEASVKAKVISVPAGGGTMVHAHAAGLVVIAQESWESSTLKERVLTALRALYIRRPTPGVFNEALEKAQKAFKGGSSD